ncbi:MAG: PEGA domain-containing protein [Woeseiaceae bacterium]|nr:PEGA domain-containing protein [Woeseiaceae bacterium]
MFAIILAALLATGCASITRGTTELFVIETTPSNTKVTLSNGMYCTTPCSLKVPRRGDFVVTIERPGYETVRTTVESGIDGEGTAGMAGNVLFGGVIGAGIDASTGAMHSHQPNPLIVTLVPVGETAADNQVTATDGEPAADAPEQAAEEGVDETAEDLADGESLD